MLLYVYSYMYLEIYQSYICIFMYISIFVYMCICFCVDFIVVLQEIFKNHILLNYETVKEPEISKHKSINTYLLSNAYTL